MFSEVEHLKSTKIESPEAALDRIADYCKKKKTSISTLLKLLVRSYRQKCPFNFADDADMGICSDSKGEEVAFTLESIAEAYGYKKNKIRCREINERGCCARINCLVTFLEMGLHEYYEEESGPAGEPETEG